jgi:alternate signal-mediated exported protein
MKKLLAGAIAGTVGLALLLGGAGTFALWSSTATVSSPAITAGDLQLTSNANGVWKDGATTIDPATFLIVPGKVLTYTQTLTVLAKGDGIKADLTASNLTGSGTLSTLTTNTLSIAPVAATGISATGQTINVTAAGTYTVNVTMTVTFNSGATTGQNGTLNLSGVTFTLAQKL